MGRRRPPGRRLLVVVLTWVLIAVGLRVLVLQPERCPAVDEVAVVAAATETVDWFARNQKPDGTWLYRYDRAAERDVGGYNIVRHAGVTMSLYQADTAGHDGALAGADAGAEWAFARLRPAGGGRALGEGSTYSTGATALLASGLIERRMTTGDAGNDGIIADLGTFLVGSVEATGAVSAAYDADGGYTRGEHSIFFTGEVYWALARLHEAFPTAGYGAAAEAVERYLATDRDTAEGLFPPPSDHWAAYGLATAHPDGDLDPEVRGYVDRQAGLFGVQVRYESQRTEGFVSYVTRGRQTLAAGLGTLGEGLGNLASVVGADDLDAVTERAGCVAGMLVERQVGAEGTSAERGAWFQFDITQMDDQQHALSALLLAQPLLADPKVDP